MKFDRKVFEFDDLHHQYKLDGKKLVSVSKLIEHYVQEFDEEYWSYYTAIRNSLGMEKKDFSKFLIKNYQFNFKGDRDANFIYLKMIARSLGVTVNELSKTQNNVKSEWKAENKASLEKGTNFHNAQEGAVIREVGKIHLDQNFKYAQFPDLYNLAKDVPVVYPELRMYNEEYGIAGTSDEVYVFPDGTFFISDWKTNKEIKTENKWQKMKNPVGHLDDTNYEHYRIQISTYAWMLEQFGYVCRDTRFIWTPLDENGQIIKSIPYIFKPAMKEVKSILKHFKENYDTSNNIK